MFSYKLSILISNCTQASLNSKKKGGKNKKKKKSSFYLRDIDFTCPPLCIDTLCSILHVSACMKPSVPWDPPTNKWLPDLFQQAITNWESLELITKNNSNRKRSEKEREIKEVMKPLIVIDRILMC